MPDNLAAAQAKMRADGAPEQAIRVFTAFYRQLQHGASGLIPEHAVRPLTDIPHVDHLDFEPAALRDAAATTVVINSTAASAPPWGWRRRSHCCR